MSHFNTKIKMEKDDSGLFETFCETADALYFSMMSDTAQRYALREAWKCIRERKYSSNRHIAFKIINYFEQYENTSQKDMEAEDILKRFSIAITGAFPGDCKRI